MSKQIQLRGGSQAENDVFTGVSREITVDTTNNTFRVHDGATVGGFQVPTQSQLALKAPLDSPALVNPTINGVAQSGYTGFKNHIINGGFDVWQRGTSFTSNVSDFMADRFTKGRSGQSGATFSRQTADNAFNYCTRVQRDSGTTSTSQIFLNQSIESNNSTGLRGKTVTFSAYIRKGADFSGTVTMSIFSGTGIDENLMLVAITGSVTVATGVKTLTEGWVKYSITGTVPSNSNQVFADFASSSDGTAGVNDYYETTGWQLEEGSVATPFEHRPIGLEFSLCQRYFMHFQYVGGAQSYASSIVFSFPLFRTMRTIPTLTNKASGAGSGAMYSTYGSSAATTYIAANSATASWNGSVTISVSGNVGGVASISIAGTASAEL